MWLFSIWGIVFLFALLPGTLLGWLIGKLPVRAYVSVALVAAVTLLAGLVCAEAFFGKGSIAHNGGAQLMLVLLVPPTLLPMLVGIWISRALGRTDAQSHAPH